MSLLSEIRAYSDRTGTPVKTVCRKAVGDHKLWDRLERGWSAQPYTQRRVRLLIAENPEGLSRQVGRPNDRSRVAAPIPIKALPPVVDRTPCPACGTRGDIGCKHGRAGVNW